MNCSAIKANFTGNLLGRIIAIGSFALRNVGERFSGNNTWRKLKRKLKKWYIRQVLFDPLVECLCLTYIRALLDFFQERFQQCIKQRERIFIAHLFKWYFSFSTFCLCLLRALGQSNDNDVKNKRIFMTFLPKFDFSWAQNALNWEEKRDENLFKWSELIKSRNKIPRHLINFYLRFRI